MLGRRLRREYWHLMTIADTEKRSVTKYLPLARYAVTALLVAAILYLVPLGDAVSAVAGVSALPLAAALLAGLAQRVVFILRWHILLPPAGVRHSLLHTLGLGFIALFYNNFMPATFGGDLAKAYMAAKAHDTCGPDVVASVVVDRGIGLVSVIVLGFVSLAALGVGELELALWILLAGALGAALVVLVLARRSGGRADGESGSEKRRGWASRLLRKLSQTATALLHYRLHKWRLALALLVSCVGIVITGIGLQYWCVAFGFQIPLDQAVAITVMVTVVGMVPVSINGLGWTEGAKIVLLGVAGVSQPAALAMSVLQRVVAMLFSLVGGVLQFFRKPSQLVAS